MLHGVIIIPHKLFFYYFHGASNQQEMCTHKKNLTYDWKLQLKKNVESTK